MRWSNGDIAIVLRGDRGLELLGAVNCALLSPIAIVLRGDRGLEQSKIVQL